MKVLLTFFLLLDISIASDVKPVLEFPEKGMDDPVRYKNYMTRFYRDSSRNALQIYLNLSSGRVVHLWADAANESLSFTVRDASGQPAALQWCSDRADATTTNNIRFMEISLCASAPSIEIGHFLLGSMRKERDFQYFKKDQAPFNAAPFHEPELLQLIANLEKLPAEERGRHLELLHASNIGQLQERMNPKLVQSERTVSLQQISFDGKNHLLLEMASDDSVKIDTNTITIEDTNKDGIRLRVKVGTDSATLKPLDRSEIFNEAFMKFYNEMQKKAASSRQAEMDYRWLDREVRGMELVCYQDKLMAGLPLTFAQFSVTE